MQIPLGTVDWESPSEDVPRVKLHNMYVVENPVSADGNSRVSRPTLTLKAYVGTGPIYAVWRQDGCFNGDFFVVSDSGLYRLNRVTFAVELLGNVPGTSYCRFAGTSDRVVIIRDGVAYRYDSGLSTITFPDDIPNAEGIPYIQDVAVINSLFVFTVGNTQRFYWLNPTETDPDPLNYASAERLPDNIEAVSINSDEVWFIGTQGPEVWSPSTDPDLPFQRINGRVYNDGCRSRDTVVNSNYNNLPCILWVTPEDSVVLAQGSIKKISNEAVDEALKGAENLRAWGFRTNRHDFYILSSDSFTYAYDLNTGIWARWDTYGSLFWFAHVGAQSGSNVFAGSSVDNRLWQLVEGYDDDGLPVIREISGLVPNPGKPLQCASVAVRVNAGWSTSYDKEPVLELRWSDNQGATYSDYVSIGLGLSGNYAADTIFRSLGLINRPGRVFEFRFSEMARFRIDYATMNEV